MQGPHQSLHTENTAPVEGSQSPFDYTDSILVTFDKHLSLERLAAYMAQARGDRWTAIKLYEKNVELSEALYGVIQGLEVALRNAFHDALTHGLGTPEWYDAFPFEALERDTIAEAKEQILERPAQISPGRMVSELCFSFWVRLAAHRYEESLWFKYLYRPFPIGLRRKKIHERLINLKTLRNRIAHHERIIFRRDVKKDYADLLETIGWLSKDLRAWVEHTNCFPQRIARKIKPVQKKPLASAVMKSSGGELL